MPRMNLFTEKIICLHCGYDRARIVSGFKHFIQWQCLRCLEHTYRIMRRDGIKFDSTMHPEVYRRESKRK